MNLDRIPREWIIAAAIAMSVAIALQIVIAWGRRAWRGRVMRVRMERAALGEKRAISLLTESGFEILGSQVASTYSVHVDGEPVEIALRADYLVKKNRARFIAEVKTGTFAPKIETASTRRQLLEYEIAFDVDGVLLVDVESHAIHEVRFPTRETRAPSRGNAIVWTALAAAIVALIVIAQRP